MSTWSVVWFVGSTGVSQSRHKRKRKNTKRLSRKKKTSPHPVAQNQDPRSSARPENDLGRGGEITELGVCANLVREKESALNKGGVMDGGSRPTG